MFLAPKIWTICLFILPLIMIDGLIDAVSIPRVTGLLVTILLSGIWLLKQERERFLEHGQAFLSSILGKGLLLYLLIGGLSLSQSLSLSDGILEWLKMFSWFGSIFLMSFLLKEKETSVLWTKGTALAVILVGSIGVVEFIDILGRLEEDKILYLVNSTLEHKNLLATALLLSLPISFVLFNKASSIAWKGVAIVAMFLAIGLILVTQSRAAWFGLGGAVLCSLFIVLCTPSKRKIFLKPKYIALASLCLVVGIGMIWMLSSRAVIANAPIHRMQAIFTYEDIKNEHTETINERLALWNNSLEMLKEHPMLGVGLGNWKVHFPKYTVGGLRSEQGQVFFQRPHNDYLWVASEMGILGGLCYGLILGTILIYAFQLLRDKKVQDSAEYTIILVLTGGWLAFMLFSIVDFPKERPVHLLWTALLAAFIWTYRQQFGLHASRRILPSKGITYAIPIIALLGLGFMLQRWQAEWHCKKALTARGQKQYHSVLAELDLCNHWTYRLDPTATPLNWYKGEALYIQKRFPEALEAFEKAHQLHPYHIHTLNNLGATYFGLNQLEKAKHYFEQVLLLAPQFPDANMNMAAMTYNQGHVLEAVEYIGNCQPKDYKDQRFTQFLMAISKSYAEQLLKKEQLAPIHHLIQKFANEGEWQLTMHQQAKKYNRRLHEQIHLDLLFVAEEQQIISSDQSNFLTSILNN